MPNKKLPLQADFFTGGRGSVNAARRLGKHQDSSQVVTKFDFLKKPSTWWITGLFLIFTFGTLGAGLKYFEDSAPQRFANSKTRDSQPQELFSLLNPAATNPSPTPMLRLSKEYIYAGGSGKLLVVEDANANAVPPSDLGIWRPSTGYWWIMNGQTSQYLSQAFGMSGDVPVP